MSFSRFFLNTSVESIRHPQSHHLLSKNQIHHLKDCLTLNASLIPPLSAMFSLSVWLPFIWKRKRTTHLSKFQEFTRTTNIQVNSVRPGQTIETFQRDLSHHCREQHVARVWSRCCDVLRHIQCWKPNYCTCPGATLLHEPGQSSATSCHIQICCMKTLTIPKLGPTTPNMSQQSGHTRATGSIHNVSMLRWHVAIVWPGCFLWRVYWDLKQCKQNAYYLKAWSWYL